MICEVREPRNPWPLAGSVHPMEGYQNVDRGHKCVVGGTLKMELMNAKKMNLGACYCLKYLKECYGENDVFVPGAIRVG